MSGLESKIEAEDVFDHIRALSGAENYDERIGYITDFLQDYGLIWQSNGSNVTDVPFFYTQVLPEKWQKRKGMQAKNVVAVIPAKSDEAQVWVAHNDTTQDFDFATKEFWKKKWARFTDWSRSPVYRKIKGITDKPVEDTKQYGANDNGSGCALLLEAMKSSLKEQPDKTQVYLFSGAEEGLGKVSIVYGLFGGLGLMAAGLTLFDGLRRSMYLTDIGNDIIKAMRESHWQMELAMDSLPNYFLYGALALTLPFLLSRHKPFDRFRIGVIGSKHYVDTLDKEEIGKVESAVSVDMLAGDGDFIVPKSCIGMEPHRWIFMRKSDVDLNIIIKSAVYEAGGRFTEYTPGSSDHIAFHERGVSSAAMFADVKSIFTDIHTKRDVPENVNIETLAKSCQVLSLLQRKLSGERNKDLRKRGDYAMLFKDRKTGGDYIILRNMDDDRLVNQLYRVSSDHGIIQPAEFVDWVADPDMDYLARVNGLDLKRVGGHDLVVRQGISTDIFLRQSGLEQGLGYVQKAYARLQGDVAEHIIPYLWAGFMGINFVTNTLLPVAGGLVGLGANIGLTVYALNSYGKLAKASKRNKDRGNNRLMYERFL